MPRRITARVTEQPDGSRIIEYVRDDGTKRRVRLPGLSKATLKELRRMKEQQIELKIELMKVEEIELMKVGKLTKLGTARPKAKAEVPPQPAKKKPSRKPKK